MSRNAARAMQVLADCMRKEAEDLPAGMAKATMFAMARAHDEAATRIEAWPDSNGPVPCPPEYQDGAGRRR